MARKSKYSPANSAVFCVDGITAGVVKRFTPDISWRDYVRWLRLRRSELSVIHLEQPFDWLELITGLAKPLQKLQAELLDQAANQLQSQPRYIVVLGFSLGGLTALHLARELASQVAGKLPSYLAFVTFGTPFRGTGRLQDMLIRALPQDYFKAMFDIDGTKASFDQLIELGDSTDVRLLIGEIAKDEVVSASSSLHPVHWLTARRLPKKLKWGTFVVQPGKTFRAHDGLLHDPTALAYIDGLVDGLLPYGGEPPDYEPFDPAQLR